MSERTLMEFNEFMEDTIKRLLAQLPMFLQLLNPNWQTLDKENKKFLVFYSLMTGFHMKLHKGCWDEEHPEWDWFTNCCDEQQKYAIYYTALTNAFDMIEKGEL